MGRLIDDLLHLSRVSRTELRSGPVDLTALAETIVARLKEANPGRSSNSSCTELKCTGDARLLEIALTNLLDNAVKFTGPRNAARVEFGKTESEGGRHVFCSRQRRGIRYGLRQNALCALPAAAQSQRIPRHWHRPGHRATGDPPAWRAHLGRGAGGRGRNIVFHTWR